MPQLFKYPVKPIFLDDFIIGSKQWATTRQDSDNVTRNFKVSEVVAAILHALSIGTVTSIATTPSTYINVTGGTITTTGTINMALNATGLAALPDDRKLQFLRGDNTWSLPGPTPTDVSISDQGVELTADTESVNFTGNILASGGQVGFITVDFPGLQALIDSVIAGAGIGVTDVAGAITIANTGVTQVRAGGNVTLSGGTGDVTVSTTANAGTVTNVLGGTGIATITNSSSNPEIAIEYTGNNNYIGGNLNAEVISSDDIINYEQITTSNVKSTKLRDIPPAVLTQVKTYIDDADLNKVKNVEPSGFDETATAKYMVTCTISEYNAIVSKDPNTLYFIVGAGTSYTTTLDLATNNNITTVNGGTYSFSSTINGVAGTSITGPAGTSYTFVISINAGTDTYAPGNIPITLTGTIPVGGSTLSPSITGTVTRPNTNYLVNARLNLTLNDDLSTGENVTWKYNTNTDANLSYKPGPGATDFDSSPYGYDFNTQVEIYDAATYVFTSGPTYDGGAYSGTWANGTVYSTNVNGVTQNVSHTIAASIGTIAYSALLTVNDNTTVVGAGAGSPGHSWNISSATPSGSFSGTFAGLSTGTTGAQITGLNNVSLDPLNSYAWANPATPSLNNNYAWTTGPTYTWTSSGSGTPSVQTISGANGSDTLTITGQITYTAPPNPVTLTLKYQTTGNVDNPTGSIILNGGSVTLNPVGQSGNPPTTLQTSSGASYRIPSSGNITATASEGYYFSTGFNASPPFVSSPPVAPSSNADVISVLTGELSLAQSPTPTVNQTTYSGAPTATYETLFEGGGTIGTDSGTIQTVGSNPGPVSGNTFNIGNGQVTITVNKSSNSGNAVGEVTITWPTTPVSYTTIAEGAAVGNPQKTLTVTQGTSLSVSINEAMPVNPVTVTLDLDTTGITGTEFTNTGDATGATNVAVPGTTGQSFNPNLVANAGYQFTSGPFYAGAGTNFTQPNVSGNVTINASGTIVASSARTTLAVVTNITGTEWSYSGGDSPGSYYDLTPGATGSFNILVPANANYYWFNGPFYSLSSTGLPAVTNPVSYTQSVSNQVLTVYISGTISPDPAITLNYVNNIVGAPASQGATPQPLPDTSGLYTITPGPVATANAGSIFDQEPIGDPWDLGTITATAATNFSFVVNSTYPTGFSFSTQAGSYDLTGTSMPSGGGTSVQVLEGQVVRTAATIQLEQQSQVSSARFKATYTATGGATRSLVPNSSNCSTLPCTITASNYDAGLTTGNAGQVTIRVEKTTNSGITQSSGSILWGDGTLKNFSSGYNTITDTSGLMTHTIPSLGSLQTTALYSVSVDES